VRIEHLPTRRARGVVAGPRIGIAAAGDRPWRFWLAGASSVSVYRPGGRKPTAGARQTRDP
jgi:DNA-3-methyladenine glycosylase